MRGVLLEERRMEMNALEAIMWELVAVAVLALGMGGFILVMAIH
jgi:hypothetical protein